MNKLNTTINYRKHSLQNAQVKSLNKGLPKIITIISYDLQTILFKL